MGSIKEYPSPIQGVSTLAPRNRSNGQASLQDNMRSDPVAKLTRRPPVQWVQRLRSTAVFGEFAVHDYRRDNKDFRIIVEEDGTVSAWIDDVNKIVNGNLSAYVTTAAQVVMKNVNDTTFVVDRSTTVLMDPATDVNTVEGVTHINILSALNYGETITVKITKDGDTEHTVSHTVPDLGTTNPDYDTADKARATKKVAEDLAVAIDAISGLNAIAKSSAIAVWEDGFDHSFVQAEIQTGQGDRSAVAINSISQSTDGFPLYAVHGTVVTVKPDPSSTRGTYYLKAVATDPDATIPVSPSNRILQEVTWVETRAPDEEYAIDQDTMPHTVVYNPTTDQFTAGPSVVEWNERDVGDNKSVRVPGFVNNTIDNINYMQKRLVILADNSVVMSQTDDLFNFWKQSANRLVKSDPIDIASSAPGIDTLKNMIPHNKDLLVLASNAQFKIDGSTAITPETVSMPQTTTLECQTQVEPVAMGASVFFPTQYGSSTGVHEYTAQKDTSQDVGFQITHHVIGYMPGSITSMAASPNLEILALTTDGAEDNELFVYEQFTVDGEKTQLAWSKWVLPEGNKIAHITLTAGQLDILVVENGALYLKRIEMYSTINTTDRDTIFVDDAVDLVSTDGTTVTLPTNFLYNADMKVYVTDGAYPLSQVQYTESGGVLTFNEDIRDGVQDATVRVGRPFSSRYKPTRPFIYTEGGAPDTHDLIRVQRFILGVVDTHEVTMRITSQYFPDKLVNVVARNVGQLSLGEVPFETDDWKFSFKNRAELAEAEFFTDGPYAMTVAGISWQGSVFRSQRRL